MLDMDISAIAVEKYIEVEAGERLAQVRSIFEHENPKGIVVTEEEAYAGVIGEKQLLRSQVDGDTKAAALMRSAPELARHEDVRESARQLVEGDVKVAPVYEGERLYGIVTSDGILEAVLDNLDAITVDQIYTDDVVSVREQAEVGSVINLLREHGISRVPALDDSGDLSGVITTNDIVNFVVRDRDRQGSGDRSGDIDRMLDVPAYDLMSSPVVTSTPNETVQQAVQRMFDNDISGLVVTPADDTTHVTGVVTKTDVLRALTFTEQDSMDVQITNVELLDTVGRQHIVAAVEEVAEKYEKMDVLHAHVRLHEHKEKLRGTPLIQCQIRLRTNKGQAAGTGEGYGAEHAFHVALDKLERNVLEIKGVEADEEYRGQLLRKLGEL